MALGGFFGYRYSERGFQKGMRACLHLECVVNAELIRPIFQELADSNQ